MIPALRQQFNEQWTPEKYAALNEALARDCGGPIPFRVSETMVFFERSLLERMARYGQELVAQIVDDAHYLAAASERIPEWFRAPKVAARPLFVQADFGIDERGEPMLVEIQGFPSLYAYQSALAESYRAAYEISPSLTSYFDGLDVSGYRKVIRRALVGDHDPENVVLLEVQPEKQKTYCDFFLTERYFGVRPVCVSNVQKDGDRLYYERDNRRIPIERLYNRVIAEEFARAELPVAFDWRDDLEVEWAGHPSWYFLLSKFSLPYFRHPAVPETHFLDKITEAPRDLSEWVLKPLFSFAGQGVKVGPTPEDIAAVSDPANYILQRKINFVPIIETPAGPTKVEIRIMYIWGEGKPSPTPLTALLRTGRGALMGVDANRQATWVGASAAFFP